MVCRRLICNAQMNQSCYVKLLQLLHDPVDLLLFLSVVARLFLLAFAIGFKGLFALEVRRCSSNT